MAKIYSNQAACQKLLARYFLNKSERENCTSIIDPLGQSAHILTFELQNPENIMCWRLSLRWGHNYSVTVDSDHYLAGTAVSVSHISDTQLSLSCEHIQEGKTWTWCCSEWDRSAYRRGEDQEWAKARAERCNRFKKNIWTAAGFCDECVSTWGDQAEAQIRDMYANPINFSPRRKGVLENHLEENLRQAARTNEIVNEVIREVLDDAFTAFQQMEQQSPGDETIEFVWRYSGSHPHIGNLP